MVAVFMDNKAPECFGDIETVFPKGKNGLRCSPEPCLSCFYKTACLKSAMESMGGLAVKREMVDRAYTSGTMTFLERWSHKKMLYLRLRKSSKHRQKRRGA